MLFVCDMFHGMRGGVPEYRKYTFDTKMEIIIVPFVVKLRHAKAVGSRQYQRKKPVSGMHSTRNRNVCSVFYFPEKTL